MPKKSLALFVLLLVIAGGSIACGGSAVDSTPRPAPRATSTVSRSSDTVSDAEASYVTDARRIASIYTEAFQSISELSASVSAQPTLLVDASWQNQMASAFARVKMANELARKLNPPPRFRAANSYLIEATHHYDQGIDLFADGIDKLDPSLLAEAIQEFTLGNDAMDQATSALK